MGRTSGTALIALAALVSGCTSAPSGPRPGEEQFTHGYGAGFAETLRDDRYGLVGPRWRRLLEPDYARVVLFTGRCVFTRRPGAETYERWQVRWPEGPANPELEGPEPTPWRWIARLEGTESNPEMRDTSRATQPGDLCSGLASEEAPPDGHSWGETRAALSVLDPDGVARGRVVAVPAPHVWHDTLVFDAVVDGARVTELLQLDGRRKIPPLPPVTWVDHEPAVTLDPALTGRPGLVWPLDPETGLPVLDLTRSVVGFEPLLEQGSAIPFPAFCGFIAHHRTPEGPRVGWCSPDLSSRQGPVARAMVNAVAGGFEGVALERLEGGWIVCQIRHERPVAGPARFWIETIREAPEPTAERALAACMSERQEADRLYRLEVFRRESEEHLAAVQQFDALLDAPQPSHTLLAPLAERLGAVFGVRYVLRHHPRRVEYVNEVLAQHEREAAGWGSFATDEQVAQVRAFRDQLLAEQRAREEAERDERARRDAERAAAERRRREEAAAAAARWEQEHANQGWGGSSGETPGERATREAAATRAVTESLFRHTYGQQDWHWKQ